MAAGIVFFTFIAGARLFAAPATTRPSADALLEYLNATVDWYQRVTALASASANAPELLYRETARQYARDVARTGFEFARAEVSVITSSASSTTRRADHASTQSRNVAQLLISLGERTAELERQRGALDQQIEAAPPRERDALQARRDVVSAQLDLATTQRDAAQRFAGTLGAAEGTEGTASLPQRIDDLARSIAIPKSDPNADSSDAAETAATVAAAASTEQHEQQQNFSPRSAGLFGLIAQIFTLSGRMAELKDLAEQAQVLEATNDQLRAPLRAEITEALRRSTTGAATRPAEGDVDALGTQRRELEQLTARFKLLSAAAIPAREQATLLAASRENLLNWRTGLRQQYAAVLRHLLLRLGILVATIAVLIVISRVWRRATYRYVQDARRRRQLLVVRRIVIAVVVVIIVIGSIVSEFGSLATFAGLITAGIAVALQTIILSGVAYFFFIGRFGVRTGDRVTVNGITGEVIEVGLFRLYLMELSGKGQYPTGRIVAFSNAVLFQPQAFYKQLPGTSYAWNELSFTLAPDTDYGLAERRLLAAVESVFAEYREQIEHQHKSAARLLRLSIEPPKPQSRLRFTDAGLEFVVRYPVDVQHAAEIDDKITRRLLAAISDEPKLKLVPTGTPRIQSAG